MSLGVAFRSSDSLDCYDWVVWSCWGLFHLLFSLCGVFYNVQSLCFESVVWPCRSAGSLVRTITTSFVGRKSCFSSVFTASMSCCVRLRGVGTWWYLDFGFGPTWVGVLLVWNLGNLTQLFVMPWGVVLLFRGFGGLWFAGYVSGCWGDLVWPFGC